MGSLELVYFKEVFKKKSFLEKVVYKTIIYLTVIVIFLILNAFISNAVDLKTGIFNEEVLANVNTFFFNFAFWSVVIYIGFIIVITLFYAEVSDNLGQRVLDNFIAGKYHDPIEEGRIFMFLDMRDSTSIAEKIGHAKYFELLKDYYKDLSDSVINYNGEIYQYVGDEMVVTWTLEDGVKNDNLLKCFYSMKNALDKKADIYLKKYQLIPSFKAGIHSGLVTAGEIGVIKKDIVYTGDVLNTAARIQGQCNKQGVDILLSEDVVSKLANKDELELENKGECILRGRNEKVRLFTIKEYQL